jgi:excisionase family DNA binding protein
LYNGILGRNPVNFQYAKLADTMILEQYISLEEAADRLNLREDKVQGLVESGKMRGAKLPDGSLAVSEKSVAKRKSSLERSAVDGIPKENLPEYQRFKNLIGNPISISAAARKYHVHHQTISRWVARDLIQRVGMDRNRILIDEADVAYCASVHKKRGARRGTWVFKEDGTPYIPEAA